MLVRKKPKPKPKPPKKTWGDVIAVGVLSAGTWVTTVATPENISWLMSHGGRVFTLIAAVLTTAKCIKDWWPKKKQT
jgi:hypothetical protein